MIFYKDNEEKIADKRWYDLRHVFSYCVKYMYLIGGRHYGKTYSVKTWLIDQFLQYGHRFAWVRSTDVMLDKIRNEEQFFGRIREYLKSKKIDRTAIRKDTIYINGKVAGYLFPIDTQHNEKGADYVVHYCVWDEFMRDTGERAVKGRRERFFKLLESIGRDSIRRVFFLSNSTNQYDEVLQPFNVKLREFGVYLYRERNSLIHYIKPSKKYIESLKEYAGADGLLHHELEVQYGNKFIDFGDYGSKTKLRYLFTLQTGENAYISLFSGDGELIVKSGQVDNPKLKTFVKEFVNSKVTKGTRNEKIFLTSLYNNGKVLFDNGYSRVAFQELVTA